jgi:hypothetical protein
VPAWLLLATLVATLMVPHALPAGAGDILNSLSRTPPCDWSYAQHIGLPPPTGYLTVLPEADAGLSRITCFLDNWCFSMGYPFVFHHPQLLYGSLGMSNYVCTRPGTFTFDADMFLDGAAGIRVPVAPNPWVGWANAQLKITLRLIVNDVSLAPLPPLQVGVRDTVLYERWAEFTTDPPAMVMWNFQPIHLDLAGLSLSNGSNGGPYYEGIVQVLVESLITGWGSNGGGYVFSAVGGGAGNWWGTPFNASGLFVTRMTMSDQNPDLAPPTTWQVPPAFPPGTEFCGASFPVGLGAADVAGGFGMGATYFRLLDGPVQQYSYGNAIQLGPADTLWYWSVDRVGNEEAPHHKLWYDVTVPPATPPLMQIPDGSTGVQHPIDLLWDTVPDADLYRVQVDDDPGFGSPHRDRQDTSTTLRLADCQPSTTYYWRVSAHEPVCGQWSAWSGPWWFTTDVVVGVPGEPSGLPARIALARATPNPFRAATTLRLDLPAAAVVSVEVYSPDGRRVRTLTGGALAAGSHALPWDGRDDVGRAVPPGLYFCRAQVGGWQATQRLVRLR